MESIFQKMIERKIWLRIARRIRAMSNADLKDMDLTYHQNAMQELCFTAHCTAYGSSSRYILEGSIDDQGEVKLYPENYKEEKETA